METITLIAGKLNLTKPLDAAVFACLTTTFYSAAQLGEFTIPSLKTFDATKHVKPSDIQLNEDRNGHQVTVFALPQTKNSLNGKDVYWATQTGPSDHQAALANHLSINNPPNDQHLFAWKHPQGLFSRGWNFSNAST